ncbi:MAG: hypothetical protein Kow0042_29240 [Calditrichia bacterium]
MSRFICYLILFLLIFWLITRFLNKVKEFFIYQNRKAEREYREAPPLPIRIKILKVLAVLIMILCLIIICGLMVMYFTGNLIVPFKQSFFITVGVFLAVYWYYSEKLAKGK